MTFSAAPSSIGGICNAVRRLLSPALTEEIVVTSADYAPGDTAVALKSRSRRLGTGSLASWQNNTLYVTGVPTATADIEVIGGIDGAPGEPMPSGTPLRVNPRFTDYTLFTTIQNVIGSLGSPSVGLFGTTSISLSGVDPDDMIPYPANATRLLSAFGNNGDGIWFRCREFVDLPAVRAVRFTSNISDQYVLVFATPITRPTSFTQDAVADCGLSETALDIPAFGAAAILMQGQEARRVNQQVQGDPRRAEDVPITGASSSGREMYRLYRDRIDEEYSRLLRETPMNWGGGV